MQIQNTKKSTNAVSARSRMTMTNTTPSPLWDQLLAVSNPVPKKSLMKLSPQSRGGWVTCYCTTVHSGPLSTPSLWWCWWRGCGCWRCWWSDGSEGSDASGANAGRARKSSAAWRRRSAGRWPTPGCRGPDWWPSWRRIARWSACRNSGRSHTSRCWKSKREQVIGCVKGSCATVNIWHVN